MTVECSWQSLLWTRSRWRCSDNSCPTEQENETPQCCVESVLEKMERWILAGIERFTLLQCRRYQCCTNLVGDVVLVHDDKPWGFWKIALVEKTIAGQDGHVRGAVLRVAGSDCLTLLKSIALWESPRTRNHKENPKNVGTTEIEEATDVADNDDADTDVIERRPKRAATLEAREKVKAWTTYEMTYD